MTLEEANVKAKEAYITRRVRNFTVRSCGECNPCHRHLHEKEFLFICVWNCGCWWFGPWNLDEQRHLNETKASSEI